MKATAAETEVVVKARSMFHTYIAMLTDKSMSPEVIFAEPIRALQVTFHRQEKPYRTGEELVLNITRLSCETLLESIEADARDEMAEALGAILVDACTLCTSIRLDFFEIARGFDSSYLDAASGEGITGMMNLFKAIGSLASSIGDGGSVKEAGASLSRLCAAVHWLSFSNDLDASVLFQSVIQKKLMDLKANGSA